MDYVIKIGKNFIGVDSNGRYVEVSDYERAIKAPIHKVTNIINNCVAPTKRTKCKAVVISDVKEIAPKARKTKSDTVSSSIDNVIKNLSKVYTKEQGDLSQQLSLIDQEICDIQHYIEFNKFNAAEGYMAFKMLQDKLLERRVIKNDFAKFQMLSNSKISDIFDGTLEQNLQTLDEKTYTPRVLTELF